LPPGSSCAESSEDRRTNNCCVDRSEGREPENLVIQNIIANARERPEAAAAGDEGCDCKAGFESPSGLEIRQRDDGQEQHSDKGACDNPPGTPRHEVPAPRQGEVCAEYTRQPV